MNFVLRIPLNTSPEQTARLEALQHGFAQVCNALAPMVQHTRVWNRVALHHLAYRQLRERFPALGSQMVCNAIYSVSRTCRTVYQHPSSPFNLTRLGERPLPLLRFADLETDHLLLDWAREAAPQMLDRHPALAQAHVGRWLGGKAEYLKA